MRTWSIVLAVLVGLALGCFQRQAISAPVDPQIVLAAELYVLAADARRLDDKALSNLQRRGLTDRLRGGLAYLDMAIRRAREASLRLPPPPVSGASLRTALDAFRFDVLRDGLAKLHWTYPFDASPYRPELGIRFADTATRIHRNYCTGCHDHSGKEMARPAPNLFHMARESSMEELAARLVVGVRGTSDIRFSNPLSDGEIAGLVVFYRRGAVAR